MTDQDTPIDVEQHEWVLYTDNPRLIYAKYEEDHSVIHTLVAQYQDPALAADVVARHNAAREHSAEPVGTLAQQLARVLNRNSMENASNTPDFLLAEYMERCLAAAEILISRRDGWYGVRLQPGHGYEWLVDAEIVEDDPTA